MMRGLKLWVGTAAQNRGVDIKIVLLFPFANQGHQSETFRGLDCYVNLKT